MIGVEKHVLLRHYLDQGLSKAAIAERLGMDRRTISRWIAAGELDRDLEAEVRYRPRPAVTKKLDPFKAIILKRLEDYPELTAVRLLEEIRAAGYEGGYSQLRDYVREIRPRPPKEPVMRFETPPGKQGQVDFARVRMPWGIRYALLAVLGFSRLLWLRFFRRQDMRTLFLGLEEALLFFGGVPEELLFDQMKTVVIRDQRLVGGQLVENGEFLRFAAHWGFRARACRPYRAQTKGKVERPIRYVRSNFLYGREFAHDADLNDQAERWLARVANVRVHGTTGEPPIERFERAEKAVLGSLPNRRYQSLVLPPQLEMPFSVPIPPTRITVEQRPLSVYGQLVGSPS